MCDDNSTMVMTEVGPDLLTSPHVLPALIESFTDGQRPAPAQQEQLFDHLTICHYCRTAIIALLSAVWKHDRQNSAQEEAAHELLERFANISRKIEALEAYEDERLGMFAEAIVNEGPDKAAAQYPSIAAHLKICPNCHSVLDATVAYIRDSKGIS
jgi:hypothetical protein